MNPRRKGKIRWSPELAYAVGLITTDGNLSIDGRHIVIVSKDIQLLKTVKKILNLNNKIGNRRSGYTKEKDCHHLQFGDIVFYKWLKKIGLTLNKTKTIKELKIPKKYFFDFLRGHFDGDGSCYSYWDKRWDSSFMFYIKFYSASKNHILWLRKKINKLLRLNGDLSRTRFIYQLKYAKKESKILISKMYYKKNLPCLQRKYKKLRNILKTDDKETTRLK